MKIILGCVFLFLTLPVSAAEFTKGFVQVSTNQRLYVEQRPAQQGQPTLFLLNGLTYSTHQWANLVKALDKVNPNLGLVLYDMEGMGQTLLDKAPITFEIPLENQIRDLKALVNTLKIKGTVHALGLSYGGAVALKYASLYPNDFTEIIAVAPYLHKMPSQDQIIIEWVKWHQKLYPFDPRTPDQLYDHYLRVLVYTTYPVVEPIMLENPFKAEGVYQMAKGAKQWEAFDIVNKLPKGKIHLMAGEADDFVGLDELKIFWKKLPSKTKASFVIVRDTKHKVTEIESDFCAAWVQKILFQKSSLKSDITYFADPKTGDIQLL